MAFDDILRTVDTYYSGKIKAHGATHRGVDWNSTESQVLRFDQLLKGCDLTAPFSINDFGCGYGALASYLQRRELNYTYFGFDISEEMISRAREILGNSPSCTVFTDIQKLAVADYTVSSGIFNVKLETDLERWKAYINETLSIMASKSRLGFAFNMLTAYSDTDRMRPDLYYGDPLYYFDHCRRTYSRNIALLHDYGLYEFTIIVRLGS